MAFDPATTEVLDRLLGRDQHTRQPWWQELLTATVRGLAATSDDEWATNQEIRESIQRELRNWTVQSIHADEFRFRHFVPALREAVAGPFSKLERGESDLLLLVSPIGVVYRNDPGRSFHLAAEVAAAVDADPRTFLRAGAVGVISALLSSGKKPIDAIFDTAHFLRPFDWSGELMHTLSGEGSRRERGPGENSAHHLLAAAVCTLLESHIFPEADHKDELASQFLTMTTHR